MLILNLERLRMIKIVNVTKTDEFDVYIGRRFKMGRYNFEESIFHNPFRINDSMNRKQCLDSFKDYLQDRCKEDLDFAYQLYQLKDKTLGCWCAPASCHGNVIKELVDKLEIEELDFIKNS